MRFIKINLAVILFFIFCVNNKFIFATEKPVYQVTIEEFLTNIMNGQIDVAYNKILQGSLIQEQGESIKNLKKQTSYGLNVYGKSLGFELVKQQNYSDSLARMVYIVKCEKHPLIWEFYFYKSQNEWVLVYIVFNDKFDLLADK